MLDSVDVYTLQDGRYYVINGVNMPPNHPHGYIFVNRILEDYAWVFYADPYNPDTTVAFNKQGAGTWLGWNMFVTNSDLLRMVYGNLVNGECDIKISGLTENSIALCQSNQGNNYYVKKTICTTDNLHIVLDNTNANGTTAFIACIKF